MRTSPTRLRLHTDESKLYFNAADTFAAHETVTHSRGEYAAAT